MAPVLVHTLGDAAHLHRLPRRFNCPQHVVALAPAARRRRLHRELPSLNLPPLFRALGELKAAVKGQVVGTQLEHNVAWTLSPPAYYPLSKLHPRHILVTSAYVDKDALTHGGQVLPVLGSTWRWHASAAAHKLWLLWRLLQTPAHILLVARVYYNRFHRVGASTCAQHLLGGAQGPVLQRWPDALGGAHVQHFQESNRGRSNGTVLQRRYQRESVCVDGGQRAQLTLRLAVFRLP
jgi:hypothetical protein